MLKISLDSGAFSLFMRHGKQTYQSDFHNADWFKQYLDEYIEFLCARKQYFSMYVTLDVIHNDKATHEIMKYMESYGLRPLPVLHMGAEYKWIKKYVEEYEYICLGGMGGKYMSITRIKPFLNTVFGLVVKQHPMTKVHGLAVTSDQLLWKYPWYSCDAATWIKAAGFGQVLIPHYGRDHGRLFRYYITPDAPKTRHIIYSYGKDGHIHNAIQQYCKSIGSPTLEELSAAHEPRCEHNLRVLLDFQEHLKAYNLERYGLEDWGDILIAGDPLSSKPAALKIANEYKKKCTVHFFETFFSTRFKSFTKGFTKTLAKIGYRLTNKTEKTKCLL